MDDKGEIIKAIGELKSEVAVLKTNYEHMSKYIFRDLKPELEKLCDKVSECVSEGADEYRKSFQWIVATLLTAIIAILAGQQYL